MFWLLGQTLGGTSLSSSQFLLLQLAALVSCLYPAASASPTTTVYQLWFLRRRQLSQQTRRRGWYMNGAKQSGKNTKREQYCCLQCDGFRSFHYVPALAAVLQPPAAAVKLVWTADLCGARHQNQEGRSGTMFLAFFWNRWFWPHYGRPYHNSRRSRRQHRSGVDNDSTTTIPVAERPLRAAIGHALAQISIASELRCRDFSAPSSCRRRVVGRFLLLPPSPVRPPRQLWSIRCGENKLGSNGVDNNI